jgi:RNB domain
VAKDSPIDQHAAKETTTVYLGVHNSSMLPEQLSTGLSSLHRLCQYVISAPPTGSGQLEALIACRRCGFPDPRRRWPSWLQRK